jgi:hypothetical protein
VGRSDPCRNELGPLGLRWHFFLVVNCCPWEPTLPAGWLLSCWTAQLTEVTRSIVHFVLICPIAITWWVMCMRRISLRGSAAMNGVPHNPNTALSHLVRKSIAKVSNNASNLTKNRPIPIQSYRSHQLFKEKAGASTMGNTATCESLWSECNPITFV